MRARFDGILYLAVAGLIIAAGQPGARPTSRPGLPTGAVTAPVVITGTGTLPDGRTLMLSGPVTVSVGDVAPPPGPAILAIRDRTTMAVVTTSPGRAVLVLQGQSLGASGRLTIGGLTCVTSSWTPEEIIFAAPASATTINAPFIIYQLKNGQWAELCRSAPFALTPPQPTPVPGTGFPKIEGAVDDNGVPLAGLPAPGTVFRVTGKNFGPRPGRLDWDHTPLPILAWTDVSIRTRAPTDPAICVGGSLWLYREDRKQTWTSAFPDSHWRGNTF